MVVELSTFRAERVANVWPRLDYAEKVRLLQFRGMTSRSVLCARESCASLLPTFGDIDEAIDAIGGLFRKYALLLTARSFATLEPEAQEDWLAVFRQAWIREGQ